MLPSSNRLPSGFISEVLRSGKRFSSDCLSFSYKKRDSGSEAGMTASHPRFAVVVGVKVSKKAVERNRVKRLMREAVQHMLPHLLPIDGVFVAKKDLVGKPQEQVDTWVKALLEKAGVIQAS